MNKPKLALVLTILSYLWIMVTVAIAGANYPDYSHISQFMSELGAVDAPHPTLVNFGSFFFAALILLGALALIFSSLPRSLPGTIGLAILALYPLLVMVTSFFPCDAACRPATPSTSHIIHMNSALLAYLAAIVGLTILSLHARKWLGKSLLTPLGVIMPVILLVLLGNMMPDNPRVGLIQRLFETLVYGWLVFYIITLITPRKAHAARH
ncbi:DUF998 domain-containing protein [Maritalea mediterranea]|uniref:DUF998 domain-containing protein n=1 Tax=Maritalea mediterranea TaxID=2909667 RepID=A0ABS9EEV8_9HYPH|nr:DUF998 domain-containing protein [Maritalea mediterranea]MCF4099991.1 DUF998 domain-containing protein [Maritalea mediterranea]